jgi:hypothetical protein
MELAFGGVIDSPKRLHKGEAYLGAFGESIGIIPGAMSHPSLARVMAHGPLLRRTARWASKDKAAVLFGRIPCCRLQKPKLRCDARCSPVHPL